MSKIRIGNSSQLNSFLKILVEESVKKSKEQILNEEEPAEEEDEEEEEEEEAEEEPTEEEEEEVEAEEPEEEAGSVKVDFISFRDNIDSVRSGRSLKRAEVKEEVETFFNRLGSQDKRFFHDALQTLGKIMVGEMTGAEAPLPAGPQGGEMGPEPQKSTAQPTDKPETSDLEPPIRIGETQDKILLRKKVRLLMGY
jgi:hypothetical protein